MSVLAVLMMGISFAGLPQAGRAADNFVLVKQDKAISLYERWIPGGEGEKVREIKAVFYAKTNVEKVKTLLTDQQKGTDWNAGAREYSVLPSADGSSWITYLRYGMPWPFEDQDCCLQYCLRKGNDGTGEITFESVLHDSFPLQSSVSRMSGTRGRWLMEPQPDGRLQITYMVSTNRSKKVPRWVSDPVVRGNLFETIKTFRNLLEERI